MLKILKAEVEIPPKFPQVQLAQGVLILHPQAYSL